MLKSLPRSIDYDDYKMIAIVSHLRDYTIGYHINTNLELDLAKFDNIVVAAGFKKDHSFSWYFFKDEGSETIYYLIGNKCENGNLLKSQKAVDYLLVIKNSIHGDVVKIALNKLRKVKNIVAVFELNMLEYKYMDDLIEAIEMHELENM